MGDARGEHMFGNVSLGTRGGASTGSLKVSKAGVVWKRTGGGGRAVEVPADDIKGLTWIKLPRACLLLVKREDSPALSFVGLREADLPAIKALDLAPMEEAPMAHSGHNWGSMSVEGASLVFKIGNKPAFIIPLPDVAQVQQGRDEVLMQFPADGTAATDREDSLVEVAFHVPKGCPDFPSAAPAGADGEEAPAPLPASKVFFDMVSAYTDAGAAAGDAIATFDSVAVVVPRGRFDVELFASSLKLVGQAQDFRVQYDSILRVFVLPKSNSPQTLVAVCLDPPIRKGQTFYNTILCQFHNDEETAVELDLAEDALAARNEKGAKLTKEMSGSSPDVFARVLRGLSGAKLTRPGAFRDATGEGYAVRCSYKADDGFLYPLERAFFYVQKPPLLMAYDDVESVEFMRQATGITAAKTFDLAVRMRSGQDHLFRGIPRSEWANLFEWIQAKQLRIENFKEAQRGPGAGPATYVEDLPGVDAGLARQAALGSDSDRGSDEEEDEDFAASESGGSSSESDSDEEGAPKIVPEDDEGGEAPRKKAKTEKSPKAGAAPKAAKAAASKKGGGDGEKPAKKPRKKKDKDAPKNALSAFMYFSSDKRESVKTENPGISFGEIGKKLGEAWKALDAEGKKPYEAKAEADKARFASQMEEYKKKKAAEAEGATEPMEEDGTAAAGGDDE